MLRNRTLIAISLSVGAAFIGIGMVGPVRVLFAQSHGASLAIIGAMASAYLVSNFIFQYPSGWLADRWGRKQVMILGLFIQAILSLLYLLITDPILFVVLRFVEGIAAAALLPSARAMIIDIVPPEQQGEAYGIFNAFFNAGFLIGPGLGGLLAITGYASAFIGAALFRIVAIVIVIALIPTVHKETITTKSGELRPALPYRALFAIPLLGAYILAFGDYLYLGFDLTLMPLWMHDHLGASVAVIGLAYMAWSIPNIILSPIGGRLADRYRRSLMIAIFGLAQVPLYILYGLATMASLVVVLFGLHGIFYAFIQPAVDAHVATSSYSNMRARVQGMYSTVGLLGAFFGANLFSPLYAINYRLPLFTMGTIFGLCVITGSILVRISESRPKSAEPFNEMHL
ncbi:MAG: MFS transporter [Chloroflexi bacterium]|nr:MAG: MFS transporter [Chloroflexota bacterium]